MAINLNELGTRLKELFFKHKRSLTPKQHRGRTIESVSNVGKIEKVRVFDRALLAEEITLLSQGIETEDIVKAEVEDIQ